ncbi:MAG: hypothetical protein KZQ60_14015 [Candidatus Thiodiazotropha sp. (ex Lucinoma aequizonata)]|nr:hypothetical protein [Candidatus Thiodiazotropha sp. (ex Lucinoma aequizonata)]
MQYSIMTTAMTLRRLGCALCMPFISPFRSPFRSYNRAYAYRGLTAFAPLSMAVSGRGLKMSVSFTATYSSEDNKLRIYTSERLDEALLPAGPPLQADNLR